MKKQSGLKWVYSTSKKQLVPMILQIVTNALYAGCGVIFALVVRNIIDAAVKANAAEITKWTIVIVAVLVLQVMLRMLCRFFEVNIQAKLEIEYQKRLMNFIMTRDYGKTTAIHSGEYLNRLTSDVKTVSESVSNLLPTFAEMSVRLVGTLAVLCYLDTWFAIIFMIGAMVLGLAAQSFKKYMKQYHKIMQETDGKTRSFMQEALQNILMVKVFRIENAVGNKVSELQKDNYRAKIKRFTLSISASAVFMFIFRGGYVYALVWCAIKVSIQQISFGTITVILQLVGQIQGPLNSMSSLLPKYYAMIASAERIQEIEKFAADCEQETYDAQDLYSKLDSIEFENVDFAYEDDKPVLSNVNLRINKGEFVVIMGESGIGKSTIIKLVLGVYRAVKGKLYINTNSGKVAVSAATRTLFAYVPQGNLLMSGSIYDNLRIINKYVTQDEVNNALKISCCEEFINELPNGIESVIGERGIGLSEGQVQRIAIARAIISNAPIILLDEATSALDEPTEKQVLENIRSLKNKTCVIISHKKAAKEICEKQIYIQDGQVIIQQN